MTRNSSHRFTLLLAPGLYIIFKRIKLITHPFKVIRVFWFTEALCDATGRTFLVAFAFYVAKESFTCWSSRQLRYMVIAMGTRLFHRLPLPALGCFLRHAYDVYTSKPENRLFDLVESSRIYAFWQDDVTADERSDWPRTVKASRRVDLVALVFFLGRKRPCEGKATAPTNAGRRRSHATDCCSSRPRRQAASLLLVWL